MEEKTVAQGSAAKIPRKKVVLLLGGTVAVIVGVFVWYYFWAQNPLDGLGPSREGYRYLYTLTDPEKLERPLGIDVDSRGWIYVTESVRSTVEVFDGNGNHRRTIGEPGSGEGQLNYPIAVAVSKNGDVFVADFYNQRIQVFSTGGDYIKTLPAEADREKLGAPVMPTALALDEEENLYVADVNLQRILIFDSQGELLDYFGKPGSSEGSLSYPNGLTVVPESDWLLVSNSNNARVDIFTRDGEFIRTAVPPDRVANPRGVAWDAGKQWIIVVDNLAHTVWVTDWDGALIQAVGSRGLKDGQFNFPNHAALDGKGKLYISDRENAAIQVYRR